MRDNIQYFQSKDQWSAELIMLTGRIPLFSCDPARFDHNWNKFIEAVNKEAEIIEEYFLRSFY